MRTISFLWPRRLVCGRDALEQCAEDAGIANTRAAFFVTSATTRKLAEPLAEKFKMRGIATVFSSAVEGEPTIAAFEGLLREATAVSPDLIVGLGGGSVLDVAKLVAAFLKSSRPIQDAFGINLLQGRDTRLVCLPTTSGTGSEVSPNAILLDETEKLKKAVISRWLVPDGSYIDPQFMVTMPAQVTAGTGLDALTHCIEAVGNKFAHPMVDHYALEGIRLVAENLMCVMETPEDLKAREKMAVASLYGGICLGPVNTAAVHALSYPLGSEYHVPHGLSNALLLPHVLEFNLSAAPERYAAVAVAMGVPPAGSTEEIARRGIWEIRELGKLCRVPMKLSDWKVPNSQLPHLAEAAMKVTRLLNNNPREVTREDAEAIYQRAY